MKVNLAHLRERARSGGWINFVVFDARSSSGSRDDNARLLAQLTARARNANLQVDQSALLSCLATVFNSLVVHRWWSTYPRVGFLGGPTLLMLD